MPEAAKPKMSVQDRMAKARATAAANRAARQQTASGGFGPEALSQPQAAPVQREPTRQAPEKSNRPLARGQALGRTGEVLSRKRSHAGDIFALPADIVAAMERDGWGLQWCAVSVVGNTEILLDQNLMFAENGWRPVPSSRFPGRFMPEGHVGNIIRGGQMLMERPKSLSDEARAEDIRAAKQQITDRNDSLKLSGMRKSMADGFEMGGKYRGTGGDIRMSIDKGLDIPAPKYEVADD